MEAHEFNKALEGILAADKLVKHISARRKLEARRRVSIKGFDQTQAQKAAVRKTRMHTISTLDREINDIQGRISKLQSSFEGDTRWSAGSPDSESEDELHTRLELSRQTHLVQNLRNEGKRIECFEFNQPISTTLEVDQNRYRVIEGEVTLLRDKFFNFSPGSQPMHTLSTSADSLCRRIRPGESFTAGECRALATGLPNTILEVLATDSKTKQEKVNKAQAKLQMRMKFLREKAAHGVLRKVSEDSLEKLAKGLVSQNAMAGTVIVQQGGAKGVFYILRSGRAKVIKEVVIRPKDNKTTETNTITVEIDTLKPGDIFGQLSVEPSKAASRLQIMGKTHCVLLSCPTEYLLMTLEYPLVIALQRIVNSMDVNDGEVPQNIREQESWTKLKHRVFQNALHDRDQARLDKRNVSYSLYSHRDRVRSPYIGLKPLPQDAVLREHVAIRAIIRRDIKDKIFVGKEECKVYDRMLNKRGRFRPRENSISIGKRKAAICERNSKYSDLFMSFNMGQPDVDEKTKIHSATTSGKKWGSPRKFN
ncbi:hypothetical protein AAMO2058_001221500 [Amorphochlora amoebiformis]